MERPPPDVPRQVGSAWHVYRGTNASRLADEAVQALAVPDAGATAFVQMLGHKADLMLVCFRRGFEPLAAGAARALAHRAARLSRADVLVRLDRRARHVRDDGKIHEQLGAEAQAGERRSSSGLRRGDGDAAPARDEPAVPRAAAVAIRLLLPDEQASRRDAELVLRAVRAPCGDDARARHDRPPLRRAR